jgi:small subunit ribosomal protein S16
MQRTGRKGHAMFRVVVQESRYTPTSGKVVAFLGSYDPHSKTITLDKDKATFYLGNGAQPSVRAAKLLQNEGVKLPDWVKLPADKQRSVRNADKRRSTRPAEPEAEAPAAEESPAVDAAEADVTAEASAEAVSPEAAVAPDESADTEPAKES